MADEPAIVAIVTSNGDGTATGRLWCLPAEHAAILAQHLVEKYGQPAGESFAPLAVMADGSDWMADRGAIFHSAGCDD